VLVFRRKNVLATHASPMTDENAWTLDPRLAQDSIALGDLPLSRLLLMTDANYPSLILVPPRLPNRDQHDRRGGQRPPGRGDARVARPPAAPRRTDLCAAVRFCPTNCR
jgi:hypothetical protein